MHALLGDIRRLAGFLDGAVMAPKPPPLTAAELQELNKSVKSATGRRLLWEIHRLRAILLRANELQLMVGDDRFLGCDVEILKRVKTLRESLDNEPVISEEREKDERHRDRKAGLRI